MSNHRLGRWVPWLRAVHPGYFMVILSLVVTHALLAVDSFMLGRHDAPVFTYTRDATVAFGIMHIAVAAAVILALYLPERYWWIGRVGCVLSILTFNATAFLMVISVITEPTASLQLPALYIAMSMSSAACAREPLSRSSP